MIIKNIIINFSTNRDTEIVKIYGNIKQDMKQVVRRQ